jgi:hypothetical protein
MPLKAKAHGRAHEWRETDLLQINYIGLDEVCFTLGGFCTASRQWKGFVQYRFPADSRFRVLEEMDLAAYWETGLFQANFSLWEIVSGGWLDGKEDERNFLAMWREFGAREWLLATTNFSVSVASRSEPAIHDCLLPDA